MKNLVTKVLNLIHNNSRHIIFPAGFLIGFGYANHAPGLMIVGVTALALTTGSHVIVLKHK